MLLTLAGALNLATRQTGPHAPAGAPGKTPVHRQPRGNVAGLKLPPGSGASTLTRFIYLRRMAHDSQRFVQFLGFARGPHDSASHSALGILAPGGTALARGWLEESDSVRGAGADEGTSAKQDFALGLESGLQLRFQTHLR